VGEQVSDFFDSILSVVCFTPAATRQERTVGKKSLVISIVTDYTTDKKHQLEIQDSSFNINRFGGR